MGKNTEYGQISGEITSATGRDGMLLADSLPRVAALPGPATGAERQGLRCSVVGAAFAGGRAEPLISLSAPDTIARQQLPIHLQFYP